MFFNDKPKSSSRARTLDEILEQRSDVHSSRATSANATKLSPYTPPSGLVGDIAQFIYAAAPRQVPEIALAGAIGLMAGIVGRAYNVSATGLNQYVMMLAGTGTGKEAMARGISKLLTFIEGNIPAVRGFQGPAAIASGQALLKYLNKSPTKCFLSVIGEFAYKLQQMSVITPTNAEAMLKSVLLDLYNKSGENDILQPSIYSDKEKNTESIQSPAVSILCESNPSSLYDIIDDKAITNGLLPRFLLIEYDGKRPPLNRYHDKAVPPEGLITRLNELIVHCFDTMREMDKSVNRGRAIEVRLDPEAEAIANEFDLYADEQINDTSNEVVKQLWTRAHIQLLKLAALIAVGEKPYMPTVTVEHITWAENIIMHNIEKLSDHFEKGEVGGNNEEIKQQNEVKRVINEYIRAEVYVSVKKYNVPSSIAEDKVITYRYLQNRTGGLSVFKHDRIGATKALQRAVTNLTDSGYIQEIPKNQMAKTYDTSQRAFSVSDSASITAGR